jgi:hypothetical protein
MARYTKIGDFNNIPSADFLRDWESTRDDHATYERNHENRWQQDALDNMFAYAQAIDPNWQPTSSRWGDINPDHTSDSRRFNINRAQRAQIKDLENWASSLSSDSPFVPWGSTHVDAVYDRGRVDSTSDRYNENRWEHEAVVGLQNWLTGYDQAQAPQLEANQEYQNAVKALDDSTNFGVTGTQFNNLFYTPTDMRQPTRGEWDESLWGNLDKHGDSNFDNTFAVEEATKGLTDRQWLEQAWKDNVFSDLNWESWDAKDYGDQLAKGSSRDDILGQIQSGEHFTRLLDESKWGNLNTLGDSTFDDSFVEEAATRDQTDRNWLENIFTRDLNKPYDENTFEVRNFLNSLAQGSSRDDILNQIIGSDLYDWTRPQNLDNRGNLDLIDEPGTAFQNPDIAVHHPIEQETAGISDKDWLSEVVNTQNFTPALNPSGVQYQDWSNQLGEGSSREDVFGQIVDAVNPYNEFVPKTDEEPVNVITPAKPPDIGPTDPVITNTGTTDTVTTDPVTTDPTTGDEDSLLDQIKSWISGDLGFGEGYTPYTSDQFTTDIGKWSDTQPGAYTSDQFFTDMDTWQATQPEAYIPKDSFEDFIGYMRQFEGMGGFGGPQQAPDYGYGPHSPYAGGVAYGSPYVNYTNWMNAFKAPSNTPAVSTKTLNL